jgi:hypothetical protein
MNIKKAKQSLLGPYIDEAMEAEEAMAIRKPPQMHKTVRYERSEYPHPKFPKHMRGMQLLPDIIWLHFHGEIVTGWTKTEPQGASFRG